MVFAKILFCISVSSFVLSYNFDYKPCFGKPDKDEPYKYKVDRWHPCDSSADCCVGQKCYKCEDGYAVHHIAYKQERYDIEQECGESGKWGYCMDNLRYWGSRFNGEWCIQSGSKCRHRRQCCQFNQYAPASKCSNRTCVYGLKPGTWGKIN